MRYNGTPPEVAKMVFEASVCSANIPRGLFFDNRHDGYLVHKVNSFYFDKAERSKRYELIGVYNREAKESYICDDIIENLFSESEE